MARRLEGEWGGEGRGTHSRSARCLPAALRQRSRAPRGPQRNGDTQEFSMGADEATRLGARPG